VYCGRPLGRSSWTLIMFSSDTKSRQLSGGKGFFSRRKDKNTESRIHEEDLDQRPSSRSNSASGSFSSRHSRRASEPFNEDRGFDANGLSMTAGVITSIPYDSLGSSNRTPIAVDYLPHKEQAQLRREPQPHHLNKAGGDFHQYPAFDPSKMPPGPSGPRQLPQTPVAASYRDRQSKASTNTSSNPNATSTYSVTDSSNTRTSFDQASIYSAMSSQTGRSSFFSSDNNSRGAIPSHMQENTLRPSSSHSYTRQSTASSLQTTYVPSYNSATSFTPEGFNLPRPADDHVIEEQFIALMHKRGWNNLPDQARRQMLAYPAGKKWTLIHQDRLTEWQGEQKRRNARYTGNVDGAAGILAKADEEGSPEWYVKRILDDSITPKQLQSLSVSLRTQPIK
jgi:cytokinesis protein